MGFAATHGHPVPPSVSSVAGSSPRPTLPNATRAFRRRYRGSRSGMYQRPWAAIRASSEAPSRSIRSIHGSSPVAGGGGGVLPVDEPVDRTDLLALVASVDPVAQCPCGAPGETNRAPGPATPGTSWRPAPREPRSAPGRAGGEAPGAASTPRGHGARGPPERRRAAGRR